MIEDNVAKKLVESYLLREVPPLYTVRNGLKVGYLGENILLIGNAVDWEVGLKATLLLQGKRAKFLIFSESGALHATQDALVPIVGREITAHITVGVNWLRQKERQLAVSHVSH